MEDNIELREALAQAIIRNSIVIADNIGLRLSPNDLLWIRTHIGIRFFADLVLDTYGNYPTVGDVLARYYPMEAADDDAETAP